MLLKRGFRIAAVVTGISLLAIPGLVAASSTPTLNQTVNAGALSTDIRQAGDITSVTSPAVAFPALNRSFSCQTNTATLGDSSNLLNVTNFGTNNGFTLALAATGGSSATWSSTVPVVASYAYNNPAGSGCTNGQMTVDPSAATLTLDCNSACTTTGVTQGSATTYNGTTTTSATLLTSTSSAAWEGYLTGVSLSQKVPASQASGSYSLGMSITVTAN